MDNPGQPVDDGSEESHCGAAGFSVDKKYSATGTFQLEKKGAIAITVSRRSFSIDGERAVTIRQHTGSILQLVLGGD